MLNKTWLVKVCQSLIECRGSRMEASCPHMRRSDDLVCTCLLCRCTAQMLLWVAWPLCCCFSDRIVSSFFFLPRFSSLSLLWLVSPPPTAIISYLHWKPVKQWRAPIHRTGLISTPPYRRSISRWKQERRKWEDKSNWWEMGGGTYY